MDADTAGAIARLRRDVDMLKRRVAALEPAPVPEPEPEPEEPTEPTPDLETPAEPDPEPNEVTP